MQSNVTKLCPICSAPEVRQVYRGPIREGRFRELSDQDCSVMACDSCDVRWLDEVLSDLKEFYESDTYRVRVDGAGDAAAFFAHHDRDQVRHLSAIGTDGVRGKVVADVGCGAGSFLNCLEGFAKTIVAVDPSDTFRVALGARGYATFPYVSDALAQFEGEVDVVVSFSVIEHVARPEEFLRDIRRLLRPDHGRLILSTPNADDVLLSLLPVEYSSFFYRRAHLWYLTPAALTNLLSRAGFLEPVISPMQRFGIGNFAHWLRDRSPQGERVIPVSTPALDAVWRAELQRLGVSDYIFASAHV